MGAEPEIWETDFQVCYRRGLWRAGEPPRVAVSELRCGTREVLSCIRTLLSSGVGAGNFGCDSDFPGLAVWNCRGASPAAMSTLTPEKPPMT